MRRDFGIIESRVRPRKLSTLEISEQVKPLQHVYCSLPAVQ